MKKLSAVFIFFIINGCISNINYLHKDRSLPIQLSKKSNISVGYIAKPYVMPDIQRIIEKDMNLFFGETVTIHNLSKLFIDKKITKKNLKTTIPKGIQLLFIIRLTEPKVKNFFYKETGDFDNDFGKKETREYGKAIYSTKIVQKVRISLLDGSSCKLLAESKKVFKEVLEYEEKDTCKDNTIEGIVEDFIQFLKNFQSHNISKKYPKIFFIEPQKFEDYFYKFLKDMVTY